MSYPYDMRTDVEEFEAKVSMLEQREMGKISLELKRKALRFLFPGKELDPATAQKFYNLIDRTYNERHCVVLCLMPETTMKGEETQFHALCRKNNLDSGKRQVIFPQFCRDIRMVESFERGGSIASYGSKRRN